MFTTRHSARFVVFLAALVAIAAGLACQQPLALAADGPEKERELIAVLASDAPKAEKAIACKHLAVVGTSAAVPQLAKLLGDEQLASWTRIALEAIPGPAADEALRNCLDSVKGELLIGAINSIGVRRDAGAVEKLVNTLWGGRKGQFNEDSGVASAAVVALGHIGGDAAANALRKAFAYPRKGDTDADFRDSFKKKFRPLRSAIAEGLVLCAERFLSEGRSADAIEIYDEVRKAEVPKQRVLEATRGAILARKQDGIALLLELFRSPDKSLFQIALSTAREFPGRQVDEALAGELAGASSERAALVIQAMADRKETVVLPAVLKAAGSGPKEVRIAAIGALGRVGNASCVAPLLEIALESDAELVQSTKAALADLPGEDVDQDIVARLSQAQGKVYPLLIELVGQRRSFSGGGLRGDSEGGLRGEAVAALVKALDHADQAVRGAALTSLGATVPAKNLSVLIAQVVAPKHASDAPVAQQALKTACIRMPDREACAAELAKAVEGSPTPTKSAVLEILGAVGGTNALAVVGAAGKSADPQLQDVSSRLLGEWMTIDAAPVLLDLATTGPGDKYQVRALRGYIRIARQFIMPDQQRVEMCQKAFDACRQPAEQKLVLEVLNRNPNPETLKLAVKAMQVPQLKDEAAQVALAIAQKLGGKADDVRLILSKAGLEKVKLEIVKAEYGAGATQKDVTETLRKQAAELQLISLPSSIYNEAFGGDPAPGTPKQLKIQYRINGKAGEASFAENALIVLPMPK